MAKLDLTRYGAVAELMRGRAAAFKAHEGHLNNEIRAHDGSHAYGRHGYQIGWQGQLIRCATQVAPDQAFDPSGVNAVIRRWNSLNYADRMLDHSGRSVATDLVGPFNPELTDFKTVAGIIAGGFLGPEHQQAARQAAQACAAAFDAPEYAGVEYRFTSGTPVPIVMPFTAFCYGLHGRFFGMGYRRKKATSTNAGFKPVTLEFVLRCIDAFENRTALADFEGSIPTDLVKLPYMTGINRARSLAFPQIGDLFDFLQVETFSQRAVRVVMRRPYDPVAKTFGAWRTVTMFPDDTINSTGFHPGRPFFSPAMKLKINAMKQKKFPPANTKKYAHLNFNKELYDWTGRTCDMAMTPSSYKTHIVPGWS
jgi:hypothetical protein